MKIFAEQRTIVLKARFLINDEWQQYRVVSIFIAQTQGSTVTTERLYLDALGGGSWRPVTGLEHMVTTVSMLMGALRAGTDVMVDLGSTGVVIDLGDLGDKSVLYG